MEDASENDKESLHSAHANGMNEWINVMTTVYAPCLGPGSYYHQNGTVLGSWQSHAEADTLVTF